MSSQISTTFLRLSAKKLNITRRGIDGIKALLNFLEQEYISTKADQVGDTYTNALNQVVCDSPHLHSSI
jgi:hypothetical protein